MASYTKVAAKAPDLRESLLSSGLVAPKYLASKPKSPEPVIASTNRSNRDSNTNIYIVLSFQNLLKDLKFQQLAEVFLQM